MPTRCPLSRSRCSRLPRWLSVALMASLLLAVSLPTRAQTPGREPDIARDEARRLIPPGEPAEPPVSRLEMSPGEQRQRLSDLRQTLTPSLSTDAIMRVSALEGYLDYDQQDQMIYGPGRTRISYEGFTLEADHVLLDSRLQEVQAEGNVVMDVKGNTIKADSIRFNFDQNEGVAFNVSGQYSPVFFHTEPVVDAQGNKVAQFKAISENEAIFRSTDVTTCDFKVPHYYVRGREVVLYPKDRVFFRGATFYVMGMPVFYMPVYTHSLTESSPWFVNLGYNSRSGARIRIGYSYHHATREPSFDDPDVMVTRSQGRADLYADYIQKVGPGLGFDYKYQFEFEKHQGELSVYGTQDADRKVFGPLPPAAGADGQRNESERWRFALKHRSALTQDLTLLFNIDEFSDPDIFYDVLDLFSSQREQRRIPERRARVALTFVQEAYVLRLMADVRDRIGLDRVNDFSNPGDDNLDLNLDPYNTLNKNKPDGVASERWGRVSAKLPQLDAATRWLPFSTKPWYYRTELHLYNALDRGLNILDTRDDTYVQGVEFYQSLMRQWKLSQRYTLLGKIGVGVGGVDRTRDLGFQAPPPYPTRQGGLTFVGPETWLTGTERRSYRDINHAYAWGDTELQLNARFSDALRGWLRWRFRETTNNFLGDWHASIGDRTVREDIFNYKLRQHWVEGQLSYSLFRPLLTLYTQFGANLEGTGNLFPQEPVAYANAGTRWANQRQTLVADASVGLVRRQMFDPSDTRAYQETEWGFNQGLTYSPIHKRWYVVLSNNVSLTQRQSNSTAPDANLTLFNDQATNGKLRLTYGREIGPKWKTEVRAAYDYQISAISDVRWMLERDMHDAVAQIEVRAQRDQRNVANRNQPGSMVYDFRTGIKFKLPEKQVEFGPGDIRTLQDVARQPQLAY